MAFNEDTRVKLPAVLHLMRLGYSYLSLKEANWDESTNIFTDVFCESMSRLNPDLSEAEQKQLYENISLSLDNEDLGQEFYNKYLLSNSIKIIDFQNFENNSFHVVTELTYKNKDEEFRPDITLLINGLPFAFVEVKKPNNREGILAERNRIIKRFSIDKFRKFINITQLMVFSNNMEYDPDTVEPMQGAFYATIADKEPIFNYFREEKDYHLFPQLAVTNEEENRVLKDNNLSVVKHTLEFALNKEPLTPTNRILTSLFSFDRIKMLLQFGLAYVKTPDGLEKHIMRYPQLFAAQAIEQKLDEGVRKGIIWHTQGSGKTALAYYSVKYLTSYFQKKGIIPKFYFIVDRLDLLTQASSEFDNRGLVVNSVNSKEDFITDIKKQAAIHNLTGQREITVVNIHKFSEESTSEATNDYNLNVQRIYFLDEVHRSYNPKGSFLANLINSDKNAIIIGLTGTPLIAGDVKSRQLFGDYIHKYYYNSSIADGYTLRLIREGIETSYRMQLAKVLEEIQVLKGDIDKKQIYAHPKFVKALLEYIINDFKKSRNHPLDPSVGGMIVCESNEQAKVMFDAFTSYYGTSAHASDSQYAIAAEPQTPYGKNEDKKLKAALILHDVDDKEARRNLREEFKEGKTDILIVNNMLLTGFDAKRLKKLYLTRVIRDHNLLQTLTRVNRPYKDYKYGYVVDFADIRKEFDKTNKAYFDELQAELGDEMQSYSDLFKSSEEIEQEIEHIKDVLFRYDLDNAEIFSQQINQISDRKTLLELKNVLQNSRELYNLIRLFGYFDLADKLDFQKLNSMLNEVSNHLALVNEREALQNGVDTTNLLNTALEDIVFMFRKVSEEELILADELKEMLRKTRETMLANFDPQDPLFVSLREELERMFKKKNLDEITQDQMRENIGGLQQIYDRITELNRKNALLKAKYENDAKYARIHKNLMQRDPNQRERVLYETLIDIKHEGDERILRSSKLLNNEAFFSREMIKLVIEGFNIHQIKLDAPTAQYINDCIVREYVNEYKGISIW